MKKTIPSFSEFSLSVKDEWLAVITTKINRLKEAIRINEYTQKKIARSKKRELDIQALYKELQICEEERDIYISNMSNKKNT